MHTKKIIHNKNSMKTVGYCKMFCSDLLYVDSEFYLH